MLHIKPSILTRWLSIVRLQDGALMGKEMVGFVRWLTNKGTNCKDM